MKKEVLLIRRLLGLKLRRAPEVKGLSRELSPDLNWAFLLDSAKQERIASLLYRVFSQSQKTISLVPKSFFKHIENVYLWAKRDNMLSFKMMKEIISAFKQNNIEVIVFKGPILAELIYNDLGLRPMRDWDILIKPEDFTKADRLLENKFGYLKRFRLDPPGSIKTSPYRNSILYNNPSSYPKHVHLYWHLINLLPYNNGIMTKFKMERLWHNSAIVNLGNLEVRTLSIEDHLIYLCLHALNHGYRPLLLHCDINEVIIKNDIDWGNLVEEAFEFGLSKQVYYGLYLASEILKTDIPSKVLIRLRPKRQGIMEKRFFSSLVKGELAINDVNTAFFLNLIFNETVWERAKFAFSALFPPGKDLLIIRQNKEWNQGIFVKAKRAKAGLACAGKCLCGLIFN